jgi:hypothetical protein
MKVNAADASDSDSGDDKILPSVQIEIRMLFLPHDRRQRHNIKPLFNNSS